MIDLLRRLIRAYCLRRKHFTICPCGMPLTEAEIKQNKLWKRSSIMYCADCFEREFPSSVPHTSGIVRGTFTELLEPGLRDLYAAQQGPTEQHPLAALMSQQVAGLQDPAALQNMAHQSGIYQMQMLQDQNRRSLTSGLFGTAYSDPVAGLQDPAALQNIAYQSGMYQQQLQQAHNQGSFLGGLAGTACSDPVASLFSSLFGGGRNGIQH